MPPTASDSSCSKPEVAGPMVQMSLVRLVLRNPFSLSSASVTASTSMELERAWSGCEAGGWSPKEEVPLSVTITEGSRSDEAALIESFGKTGTAVVAVVVVTGNRRLKGERKEVLCLGTARFDGVRRCTDCDIVIGGDRRCTVRE